MSLLAIRIGAAVLALLALFALRGKRWAYLSFIVLALLSYPAQAHWRVHAPKCQLVIPTMQMVVLGVQTYVLVAVFAVFCWMSWVQFRWWKPRVVWAFAATVLAGALVEVAEGMTTRGSCRVRDLVPAAAAGLGVALVLAIWARLTRKPGYVRLGKPRSAAAPRKAVPAPKPSAPLRGIPTIPVASTSRYTVPPPQDFSPTAPTPAASAPGPDDAPTEEVAPREPIVVAREMLQRVLPVLRRVPAVLLAVLQRIWTIIRGRTRAIAITVLVLVLLAGAAVVVVLFLPAPPPTVVEQPKAPPPPPRRALQSDAEGYYEPSYNFVVADRRFTKLTLRPETFVTFSRVGTRQEAGCADPRIRPDAVYLRCELDRVGLVTIDGRFTSRYVTSRLDTPVLSAMITVTNTRGEVLYRGRDHFRWHEPN